MAQYCQHDSSKIFLKLKNQKWSFLCISHLYRSEWNGKYRTTRKRAVID